jgi:hypothetical protein
MASLIEVRSTNDVNYTLAGTEKILPRGAISQQRLAVSLAGRLTRISKRLLCRSRPCQLMALLNGQ